LRPLSFVGGVGTVGQFLFNDKAQIGAEHCVLP